MLQSKLVDKFVNQSDNNVIKVYETKIFTYFRRNNYLYK